MSGYVRLYRIVCVKCDWHTMGESDEAIYGELSVCPDCKGPTDAYEVKKER